MMCPRCNKNVASLRVTEVTEFHGAGHPDNEVSEEVLCEVCAQTVGLPTGGPAAGPAMPPQVWKLLQMAQKGLKAGGVAKSPKGPTITCKGCGLSLEELRRGGRVGCEHCYRTFDAYLTESLERMHGATQHVGRVPGVDEAELQRMQRHEKLRDALASAIREEDYERAANLRDEIADLDDSPRS